MLTQSGLAQAQARSKNSIWEALAIFGCLYRHVSRELDWKHGVEGQRRQCDVPVHQHSSQASTLHFISSSPQEDAGLHTVLEEAAQAQESCVSF